MMKNAQHTETIVERVACVKPGRTGLLKVCVGAVVLIGIFAVATFLWAAARGYDLNRSFILPRLIPAALLVLAGAGLFKSIREERVQLRLEFFRDRLVLTYDRLPSLWQEGTVRQVTEIPYRSMTGGVLNTQRMRLTLRCVGYTRTRGEEGPKQKTGVVTFSVLDAQNVDFVGLLERYASVHIQRKG